jgi:hypothetical protein
MPITQGAEMKIEFVRTLRTPYSERFLLVKNSFDIGAMDIHYRLDGTAAATLIILEDSTIPDAELPALLTKIDEVLFPEISVVEKNLFFTVVRGKVIGTFLPEK